VRPEVTALPCAVSAVRPDGATLLRAVSERVHRRRNVAARRVPHVRAGGARLRHGDAHDVLPRLGFDGLDAVRHEDEDVLSVAVPAVGRTL
jgi:capsular polysaccharide biosynthesis protein